MTCPSRDLTLSYCPTIFGGESDARPTRGDNGAIRTGGGESHGEPENFTREMDGNRHKVQDCLQMERPEKNHFLPLDTTN
jgi:hypothetical protein